MASSGIPHVFMGSLVSAIMVMNWRRPGEETYGSKSRRVTRLSNNKIMQVSSALQDIHLGGRRWQCLLVSIAPAAELHAMALGRGAGPIMTAPLLLGWSVAWWLRASPCGLLQR